MRKDYRKATVTACEVCKRYYWNFGEAHFCQECRSAKLRELALRRRRTEGRGARSRGFASEAQT